MAGDKNETKIQVVSTLTCELDSIKKRSGETVPFDAKKIFEAIKSAVAVTREVSDADIVKIAAHIKHKIVLTDEELERADVNSDGNINVTDIIKIAAHIKGKKLLK